MALSKNTIKNIYGKDITFENAYIKITNISGNKELVILTVSIYSDNTQNNLIEIKEYNFIPNVENSAPNFIKQGYEYLKTLDEYKEAYGSDSYGLTAYLLNKIRVYSIPFGFVAIVVAAIYQYIIGLKKLDTRDKGFGLMITAITLVVICQVLPLVFAIVVKGWRG